MGEKTPLEKLREPFTDGQISKLPKPTFKGAWDTAKKQRCHHCHGYHPLENTIHLDYVGHAALTDRLLDVDLYWTWEPLALDEFGLPAFDRVGGLWIKLTVDGVTRLGYGDAQGKAGPNAVKEAIGDALRNAAMRFGAALDLWHKGDLHQDDPPPKSDDDVARDELLSGAPEGWNGQKLRDRFYSDHGFDLLQADAETVRAFTKTILAEAEMEPA